MAQPSTPHGPRLRHLQAGDHVRRQDVRDLKKIDVQGNPDGYLNDPYNHRFYILSHSAPNVTVLDDKDGSILGTIDIGGAPEQAVTDGKGKIYVDIEDKAAIAVIDANTMKMIGKYDVSSKGGGCAGLALDAKNNILFAACRDNKNMIILSATDGHIITDLPIGIGSDGATFNPATHGSLQLAGRRDAYGHQGEFAHQLLRRTDGHHTGTGEDPDAGYQNQPDFYHHRRVWSGACRTGAKRRARLRRRAARAGCAALAHPWSLTLSR